jgi:hypothetical protein
MPGNLRVPTLRIELDPQTLKPRNRRQHKRKAGTVWKYAMISLFFALFSRQTKANRLATA